MLHPLPFLLCVIIIIIISSGVLRSSLFELNLRCLRQCHFTYLFLADARSLSLFLLRRFECRCQTKLHVLCETRGNAKSLTEPAPRRIANNARCLSLADHLYHILVCGCGSPEAHKQTIDGEATPCTDQSKSRHPQGADSGVDQGSGQWLEGGGGRGGGQWQYLEQAHQVGEGGHTRVDGATLSAAPPLGQCQ